jgi:hypothetical protein
MCRNFNIQTAYMIFLQILICCLLYAKMNLFRPSIIDKVIKISREVKELYIFIKYIILYTSQKVIQCDFFTEYSVITIF